jgi:hypothetical protein
LAGLANSEMTQAQYRRSMAAQFQSKTSDQWNFFQAKRIRRTTLETAVNQTPVFAFAGEWTPDRLVFLFDRLAFARRQTATQLKTLHDKLGPNPKTGADDADYELRKLLEAWDKPIDEKQGTPLADELAKTENKQSFAFLGGGAKLPQPPPLEIPTPTTPEEATANHFLGLNRGAVELAIQDSINRSAARAKAGEDSTKPIVGVLRIVDERLKLQLGEAERVHRAVQGVELAFAKMPPEGRAVLQPEVAGLETSDRTLSLAANECKDAVLGLKDDFDARRYKLESDDNKAIAEHYEVMVRFQGTISERHRLRSKEFFFGMLFAQAGVVIASTALAAKQKSILWSLAAVAGATAMTFAVYVYLWV